MFIWHIVIACSYLLSGNCGLICIMGIRVETMVWMVTEAIGGINYDLIGYRNIRSGNCYLIGYIDIRSGNYIVWLVTVLHIFVFIGIHCVFFLYLWHICILILSLCSLFISRRIFTSHNTSLPVIVKHKPWPPGQSAGLMCAFSSERSRCLD